MEAQAGAESEVLLAETGFEDQEVEVDLGRGRGEVVAGIGGWGRVGGLGLWGLGCGYGGFASGGGILWWLLVVVGVLGVGGFDVVGDLGG